MITRQLQRAWPPTHETDHDGGTAKVHETPDIAHGAENNSAVRAMVPQPPLETDRCLSNSTTYAANS